MLNGLCLLRICFFEDLKAHGICATVKDFLIMVIFAVFRYKVTDFLEDNGWFGLFFVSSVVCPLDNAHA